MRTPLSWLSSWIMTRRRSSRTPSLVIFFPVVNVWKPEIYLGPTRKKEVISCPPIGCNYDCFRPRIPLLAQYLTSDQLLVIFRAGMMWVPYTNPLNFSLFIILLVASCPQRQEQLLGELWLWEQNTCEFQLVTLPLPILTTRITQYTGRMLPFWENRRYN